MLSCLQSMTKAVCPQLAVLKLHCKHLGSRETPLWWVIPCPIEGPRGRCRRLHQHQLWAEFASARIEHPMAGTFLSLDVKGMRAFTKVSQEFQLQVREEHSGDQAVAAACAAIQAAGDQIC